jgi:hypothetical protein
LQPAIVAAESASTEVQGHREQTVGDGHGARCLRAADLTAPGERIEEAEFQIEVDIASPAWAGK